MMGVAGAREGGVTGRGRGGRRVAHVADLVEALPARPRVHEVDQPAVKAPDVLGFIDDHPRAVKHGHKGTRGGLHVGVGWREVGMHRWRAADALRLRGDKDLRAVKARARVN